MEAAIPSETKFVDNYNVHSDNWTQETWDLLLSGLRQLLDDTSGVKAAIGMEAQVTTNIDGPKAHRRLMEDIRSDRVKVNLDPSTAEQDEMAAVASSGAYPRRPVSRGGGLHQEGR